MAVYRVYRFVHVGINPKGAGIETLVPNAAIEAYLTANVPDWFRYAAQNYVLWTNLPVADVARQITNIGGLSQMYVFAVEFHATNQNGMMPQNFWNWLYKPR
jgi:hypothetical protein